MKKGSLIGVEGRIQTSSFEGQDGKRVYSTDVVADSIQFLEPRSEGGQGQPNNNAPQQQYQAPSQQNQHSYQQPSQQYQPPSQQSQPTYNQTQQNYSRVDEDPFANSVGPIPVSEDDLPFD